MGYSGENVLYRTARYSDPGTERMGYSAALHPIKSLYTPFPRYQCGCPSHRHEFEEPLQADPVQSARVARKREEKETPQAMPGEPPTLHTFRALGGRTARTRGKKLCETSRSETFRKVAEALFSSLRIREGKAEHSSISVS